MLKNEKTHIVLLTAVSGGGKSTVAKKLCTNFGAVETTSHTTRRKRSGEKDQFEVLPGEKPSYFFISKEEFEAGISNNEFIEHVKFGDNYYGVHKSQSGLSEFLVIVVEPEGQKQINKFYENDDSVIITNVLLIIKEETQIERMRLRGDSEEDIKQRMKIDNIRETSKELTFDLVFNAEVYSADAIANMIFQSLKERI